MVATSAKVNKATYGHLDPKHLEAAGDVLNLSDLYGNWLYGKMSKTKPTAIRDAEQIDEATKRLASIDRGLASLQCQWRQRRTKDLREQVDAVRRRRDRARIELLEIVELAETPVDLMGWP